MLPRLLRTMSASNRDLVERISRIMLRQKPETVEQTWRYGQSDSRDFLRESRSRHWSS
jgi:hypothetical protein